jgi:hypothetical protein
MPNDSVFDSKLQPVSIQMVNTFRAPGVAAPPESGAAKNGTAFSYSYTSNTVLSILGGTGYAVLQISNPSLSGKSVYITSIQGGIDVGLTLLSSFTGIAQVTRGGTLSSPSTVTPINLRLGASSASVVTLRTSAANITGGTSATQLPLQQSDGYYVPINGQLIIPPGQTLELLTSGTVSLLAVTMLCKVNLSWWEL